MTTQPRTVPTLRKTIKNTYNTKHIFCVNRYELIYYSVGNKNQRKKYVMAILILYFMYNKYKPRT